MPGDPKEYEAMSELKDGYCWCDMCGFNAKLPAKFRAEVEDSYACPWCKEAGGGMSLLCVGDELEEHVIPDDPMMTWPQTDPRAVWFDKHLDRTPALYPTLSGFANWYALHGIPLGIGRENARVIYDAAVNDFAERSDRWFRAIQQELDTVKAAFEEVAGQRDSLLTEVGNLRVKLHYEREVSEAAIAECKMAVIDTTIAHNDILERIELTFSMLYDKWLSAGHRRDMNDAMELMARELGKPICPDCKCELVTPGNTCSQCDRPPEGMTDNIIHSARMRIPGA